MPRGTVTEVPGIEFRVLAAALVLGLASVPETVTAAEAPAGLSFRFGGGMRGADSLQPSPYPTTYFPPPEATTHFGFAITRPSGLYFAFRTALTGTDRLDPLAFTFGVGRTWTPHRMRLRLEAEGGVGGVISWGDVVYGFHPQMGVRFDVLHRFPGEHGGAGGYVRLAIDVWGYGILEFGLTAEFGRAEEPLTGSREGG